MPRRYRILCHTKDVAFIGRSMRQWISKNLVVGRFLFFVSFLQFESFMLFILKTWWNYPDLKKQFCTCSASRGERKQTLFGKDQPLRGTILTTSSKRSSQGGLEAEEWFFFGVVSWFKLKWFWCFFTSLIWYDDDDNDGDDEDELAGIFEVGWKQHRASFYQVRMAENKASLHVETWLKTAKCCIPPAKTFA